MIACAPDLDPELQARVTAASDAVPVVLDAAAQIRHDTSDAQIHALALHGTITELFSACILLAKHGEPTAIPIILRSMYEALVDLDNLVHDAGYVEHIQAANLKQTIKIMKSTPLKQEFQEGRKADYQQFVTQLAELEAKDKGALRIRNRCDRAGRLDEYESLYALFCLDTHNNGAALADRHLSELPDGKLQISFFGEYDPRAVARRLDFGLRFLLESARMIHGAFQVPAPQLDEIASRLVRAGARPDTTRENPSIEASRDPSPESI
jgi:Family of unknown function (DUF5677)